MQIIHPEVEDNPRGANPETSIYIAINKLYPQYELTQENSVILDTQPWVSPVLLHGKRVFIQKGQDPNDTYQFFYECYNVPQIFPAMVFTDEQLTEALKLRTSAELIEYIGLVNNLNLRKEDWWCSDNSIDFAGGENRPNFVLEAKSNAQWYTGWRIINLWK
ncbi:hypothetical protein PHABIO_232 [Pseudomonas phage Phabio]|uniref:Uncharacterized protein n=1 Tax=Pseudomonas phage Phabio TaxID=2006668 RepID=A0A1Y0SYN0_9CAUD|nr:hypothetical protein MZD05_gp232 [Pseudomonas phage Phabio]ARV76863.1 hypothetical protein PHABIO_232 [Pseudomonas phage Phabio]